MKFRDYVRREGYPAKVIGIIPSDRYQFIPPSYYDHIPCLRVDHVEIVPDRPEETIVFVRCFREFI